MKTIFAAMFLAVAAVISAIIYAVKKKNGSYTSVKGEFDERQELIRGRGYKIAFVLCMIEFVLIMFIEEMEISLPLTYGAIYAIAFVTPVCAFVVYCISKDAFVGIKNNIRRFIPLAVIITLIDIASTVVRIVDGELIVDGKLTGACITPACGVLFLTVLVSLLVKSSVKAEEGNGDEES